MSRVTSKLSRQDEVTIQTMSPKSWPRKITRRNFLEGTIQTSAAFLVGDLFSGVEQSLNAAIEKKGLSQFTRTKPLRSVVEDDRDISTVKAVQHIRRMRGGAQAHLFRCSDGHFYVVKFRNNPQHLKVLANEMLVALLANLAGLPVPRVAIVDVAGCLIGNTPELKMELSTHSVACVSGLQFGSQYVVTPWDGQVLDYLPSDMLARVRNIKSFAGILALDKWTSNTDGRQAAFWRWMREKKYTATFIDQGYCFNGGEWTFPDYALRGVFPDNEVYDHVCNWESFEPWLSRIEHMSEDKIWLAAGSVPPDWYLSDWHSLEKLVETLLQRQTLVRDLITAFRTSIRQPFPKWTLTS